MSKTKLISSAFLVLMVAASSVRSAERPTMNHTCDPRPDILAHPFYYAHTEYRRAYNRPRDMTGWIANKIAPSSQEAMVWCENVQAGNYDQKDMPPMCKTYYYPKPWEAMLTGARPDFPKQPNASSRRSQGAQSGSQESSVVDSSVADEKQDAALAPSPSDEKEPMRLPPVPVPPNPVR